MPKKPVLHDLLGAKRVTPVDQRHRIADIGKIERLLDSRVAAADHRHVTLAIEEAVTGGAGRNTTPVESLLRVQAEPPRLRAGGDNHRVRGHHITRIKRQSERARSGIKRRDDVIDDTGTDILGLLLHFRHQPRPLDHIGKAGIVLDIGRDRHLAAGLQSGEYDRRQVRARGIDGGGEAGRAGADDDDFLVSGAGHEICLRREWFEEQVRPDGRLSESGVIGFRSVLACQNRAQW